MLSAKTQPRTLKPAAPAEKARSSAQPSPQTAFNPHSDYAIFGLDLFQTIIVLGVVVGVVVVITFVPNVIVIITVR